MQLGPEETDLVLGVPYQGSSKGHTEDESRFWLSRKETESVGAVGSSPKTLAGTSIDASY